MANRPRVTKDPTDQYILVVETCNRYMNHLGRMLKEYRRHEEAREMMARIDKLTTAHKNRYRDYKNRHDMGEKDYERVVKGMMFVIHEIMKTINETKVLIAELAKREAEMDES